MSLHSYFQYEQQKKNSFFELSAGSINNYDFYNIDTGRQQNEFDGTKPFRKRRDDTNVIINKLYEATLMRRPGERDIIRIGGRKNKNEILGLTNARFVKEKHLNGNKYLRDIELVRGINTNLKNGEFILVLRTDGRIVTMSDEVEYHLNKSMRSLYTQCINIFECLDQADRERLRSILLSSDDLVNNEHRLICTLRLPKGKRPSRTREDIKTITMTGHFYSCHNSTSDRLFIARCEALVSRTTNGTSSSQIPFINNTLLKLTLNDDMTVNMVSSNVKDILDYSRSEIIGNWFGRLLATDDLEKFQSILNTNLQKSTNVRDIFDIYTKNGDNRLTFLCQMRPIRERRSKSIKYSIIAQLIDPSMRNEYMKYVHTETGFNQTAVKVEQVNLVSPTMPKASEDSIMAESPSLDMGLLMPDNFNTGELCHQQELSPVTRSLSNDVAPFVFDFDSSKLFEYEYGQCPNNLTMEYEQKTIVDDRYIKYQLEQEIASIDALINEF
jgi:PAS domain-containing protein